MNPRRSLLMLIGLLWTGVCSGQAPQAGAGLTLNQAVVVAPSSLSPRERKAVTMLVEGVEKRTGLRWPVSDRDVPGRPLIIVGPALSLKGMDAPMDRLVGKIDPPDRPESYQIETSADHQAIVVSGRDERGVLFGVGRLLRELSMSRGRVELTGSLRIKTAPSVALRGHQLGYRPKTNSYDAWDLPQWEAYIRDLAVFGTNAIELIPPRSDDTPTSPHFPRPPMEMMVGMSKLADEYGLDVWVWYPALDQGYDRPEVVQAAVDEWAGVLKQLPRLDAILVPGGDPGHTQPKYMMNLLEKQAASIRKFHPQAQMWMSPQGFDEVWFNEFLDLMKAEPAWLTGIVFGPQVRLRLPELRRVIPRRYLIRLYPDITHSLNCQYPVPEWDVAFSLTHERESINPRPLAQAAIFRATRSDSIGFLTYSEGCNDDVNKFIWSALGWDPDAAVDGILRQYAGYLISDRWADSVAQGILALERNWRGPLLTNGSVDTTLQQFQAIERNATPEELLNWRLQQLLYRAYYDAYVRGRLVLESADEVLAMNELREARSSGSLVAIDRAETALRRSPTHATTSAQRMRVQELAEALYQSIRMQLSVEKYRGVRGRGNSLDTIDIPLNNREWLEARFAEIRKLDAEPDRSKAIQAILDRTDPGPGGFYDDLGDLQRQPHLVKNALSFEEDPDFRRTSVVGFEYFPKIAWPIAWTNTAQTLYATPLQMQYDGLDPKAAYRIKVVYGPDNFRPKMKMDADGKEIHGLIAKPNPLRPLEFDIPEVLTRDGNLTITWTQEPGRGGNGRGCQVAEVWLMKRTRP